MPVSIILFILYLLNLAYYSRTEMNSVNRKYAVLYAFFLLHAIVACGKTWFIEQNGKDEDLFGLPFATSVLPGDTILFQGGMVYERNLNLNYAGSDDSPIVITSFGEEKAVISALNGYGLYLKGCNNVLVTDLEFRGSGRLTGNTANGIILENCRNIQLRNLQVSGFQHSGVLVSGTGDSISITGVHAHENGFAGIQVNGEWPDKYQCKNIYIGHCTAENNPGDPTVLDNHSGNGIIVGICSKVLIEYCAATNNGWDMPRKGNGPVGIWAWHADQVIIQNCISYHNKTSPGGYDGGGFDLDGGVTNSIIQYCLSYDNEGVGFGIFEYATASPLRNNTLRFNISINDGTRNGNCSVMFWNGEGKSGALSNVSIYNNVFFNNRPGGSAVSYLDPHHENVLVANNIFLTDGQAITGPIGNSQYLGNVYWNFGEPFQMDGYNSLTDWANAKGFEMLGDSLVGLNLDPGLVNPGSVKITNPDSLINKAMDGFRLNSGSAIIDKGLDLQAVFGIDPGQRDFFNQLIPSGSGYDPGVYEFQAYTSINPDSKRFIQGELNERMDDWIILYPNPSLHEILYVSVSGLLNADVLEFDIRDSKGITLQSGKLRFTGETISINLSCLLHENTLYFISFRHGNKMKTFKFLNEG